MSRSAPSSHAPQSWATRPFLRALQDYLTRDTSPPSDEDWEVPSDIGTRDSWKSGQPMDTADLEPVRDGGGRETEATPLSVEIPEALLRVARRGQG